MRFHSKEPGTRVKDRAKNVASKRTERGPAKTENPIPRSFFAPNDFLVTSKAPKFTEALQGKLVWRDILIEFTGRFFSGYARSSSSISSSRISVKTIFFYSLEHFSISGNLCYDLSDHLPNFLIVSKLSSLPANIKVFQRDYSNFDKQALVTDIQSINWDVLLWDVYKPSSMFDSFYNRISEVIDTHIPIKQLSRQELKSRSKPWINSGIGTSIRIKNGLFKKFLKTKSTYYHARF